MFKIITLNNLYFKLFQIVVIHELFQTITKKISKCSIHYKIHIYLHKHLHFCTFNHNKCRSLLLLCILIKFCNSSRCLTCSSHCLYWYSKTVTSCNFVIWQRHKNTKFHTSPKWIAQPQRERKRITPKGWQDTKTGFHKQRKKCNT